MAISELPRLLPLRAAQFAVLAATVLSGLINSPLHGLEPAQLENLNDSIVQAQTTLSELDGLAAACLQISADTRQTHQSCIDFMTALNGSALQNYLQHCANLKNWRESLIETNLAPNPAADVNPGLTLNLLLQVESLCGEQALIRHSEYIYDTYVALGFSSLSGNEDYSPLAREIRDLRQEGLMQRERQRLLDGLDDQQQRRQQEIQRQIDQQNLDLLRRQQAN